MVFQFMEPTTPSTLHLSLQQSSMRNTTFILALLFFLSITGLHLCSESFNGGCIHSEREALLKFKHDLTDPSSQLASWNEDGDCCKWYGIVCHNLTGYVLELHLGQYGYESYEDLEKSAFGGKVSESLLHLKHLEYLNLRYNNFGGTPLPNFLGSMSSLRYLNLRNAGFGGMIPSQLGNLSNLQHLNLDACDSFTSLYLHAKNLHWLRGLPLKYLNLGCTNLSQVSDWSNVINTLPSLVELAFYSCSLPNVPPLPKVNYSSLSILALSYNGFQDPVFDFVQNMTSLRELYLSDNNFSSIPHWLFSFSHLEILYLVENQLQGKFPSNIGNLTSLVGLGLSLNNFVGKIPKSFKKLCNLRFIYFEFNKIAQEINGIFDILFPCISNVLEELDLRGCELSGYIPDYLGKFKNLTYLALSHNSISGPIPISIGNLKSLQSLFLRQNNLNGTLPESFGGLAKLELAEFSYNALVGDIQEIHFENLNNLILFFASDNKLRLRVSPNWKPPPNLTRVDLGSWKVGPEFPPWIQAPNYHFYYLNLSNTEIAGPIPTWFWDLPFEFYYLNLSHNQIHGMIPSRQSFKGYPPPINSKTTISIVDLSSNNFQGPLPYVFSNLGALFLSNNSFSGPLSKFLCHEMHEPRNLRVLDIGDNLLSGEISDCWMKWKNLEVLNLNNNLFSGKIPWSIGALTGLKSLHLRNNNFLGEIPLSLKNCINLSTLDLGENQLVGSIPTWIGEAYRSMDFLSVHTNKFDGSIPENLCWMVTLRILDLSDNNLSGSIPKCLNNLSAMARESESIDMGFGEVYSLVDGSYWSFIDSLPLVTKGKMYTYYDRVLRFVIAIDLSKNKLSGQIPAEITSLEMLRYLNLSHNLLFGKIPANIGAMQTLEAVDLSQNHLVGEIPQSMAKMAFLSVLNLSFNNFNGRIPSSTQIQSFPPSSFAGNEELCGPPLIKNCSGDGEAPSTDTGRGNDDDHGINWMYVSIALGFVVGFWGTFGPLAFNRRWKHSYFNLLENLWDKILIWWHLM